MADGPTSWLFRRDDEATAALDATDDDAPTRRPTTATRSFSWLFRADDEPTAEPDTATATTDDLAEEGGGANEPAWLQRAYSSAVLHHEHQAVRTVDEGTISQPQSRSTLAGLPETAETRDGESDEEPHWLSAAATVLHRAGGKARRSVMAMVQIVRPGERERAEAVADDVSPDKKMDAGVVRPDFAVDDADWASHWLDLQSCFLCARATSARDV